MADEPTTEEDAQPTGWRSLGPAWRILAIVVLVLAVIPLVVAFTPRTNAFWGYGKPYYESWSKDRHRATASRCIDCHLEPGVRGIVTYPITFWGGLLSDVTGGAVGLPRTAFPSDQVCLRSGCHSTNRLNSPSGALRVDHGAHAAEQISCIVCHPGAGHDGYGGRFMRPPMEKCAECHKETKTDCSYCHVGRTLPAGEAGAPELP